MEIFRRRVGLFRQSSSGREHLVISPSRSCLMSQLTSMVQLMNNGMVLALLAAVDKLLLSPALLRRTKMKNGKSDENMPPYPISEAKKLPAAVNGTLLAKDLSVTRWFLLHSLANLFVCITAVNSMRAVLSDPTHAMDGAKYKDTSLFGSASVWPLTIINSVHVYHMVGGFRLSGADYFHHLLYSDGMSSNQLSS